MIECVSQIVHYFSLQNFPIKQQTDGYRKE